MHGCAEYAEMHGVSGAGPILRRVAEVAQRIALISAIGRDPVTPIMTSDDFEIGHAIARWSAGEMVRNVATHIADNQLERDVNDVERFICEAGAQGRTWREIQRKFRRVKVRDLKEIYESLEREGSIRVETTLVRAPAAGRSRPPSRFSTTPGPARPSSFGGWAVAQSPEARRGPASGDEC